MTSFKPRPLHVHYSMNRNLSAVEKKHVNFKSHRIIVFKGVIVQILSYFDSSYMRSYSYAAYVVVTLLHIKLTDIDFHGFKIH